VSGFYGTFTANIRAILVPIISIRCRNFGNLTCGQDSSVTPCSHYKDEEIGEDVGGFEPSYDPGTVFYSVHSCAGKE
jgi:hypothetical protein